jgi:SIR2-like domain
LPTTAPRGASDNAKWSPHVLTPTSRPRRIERVPLVNGLPDPLVEDIVAGRSLPLVGAGLSRDAEVPGGQSLPLWGELAEILAEQMLEYPADSPRDALEVISTYTQEYGRVRLVEEFRARLKHGLAQPGEAQLAFCRLPFDVVCTTNWDTLLERGFDIAEREYYVIVEEEQLSIGVNPRAVTLVKLHGDLDHPHRLVASEADYDRYLAGNPLLVTYVTNLLITRTPIFIGYSIDDPDFRQIMAVISDRLGRLTRMGYALRHQPSRHERNRFERRGVKCVDIA